MTATTHHSAHATARATRFSPQRTRFSLALSGLVYGAVLVPSAQVWGESATTIIEEIMVTARRHRENLQEIPVAVTAFDAESLHRNQIADLGDLQSHVPNLQLHVGDASNAVIYIRGVGQLDSISFNDPGVGVYLDDVYLGRAQGSFIDVIDPAQIEVLRGPQGTLYGRNTIGGAVKFTSAEPTDEFGYYVDVTAGNYSRQDIKASISGPLITDMLTGKLTLASLERDGYSDNLVDGGDDYDRDTFAWRGTLLFEPGDELSLTFTADSSRNTPDHSRTPHRETPIHSVAQGTFIPPGDDPFEVNVTYNDLERLETDGVALTAEYRLGDITLKSITAYREMEYRTHLDLDGTTDETFGIYVFEDQEQLSQELQLIYRRNALTIVSGVYYFKEDDITFGGVIGPDFFIPLGGGIFFPFPAVTGSIRDQENKSQAVYTNLSYELTENLGLSFGLRYTEEEKEVVASSEYFFGTGITTGEEIEQVFGTGVGYFRMGFEDDENWNDLSPSFTADYRFSDDIMAYGSVSKGFKSGGFNGRLFDRAQPFDPEELLSYELGLKSMLLEHRMRLNMALFYNDYTDFQLSRPTIDPDTGGVLTVFENAGSATIYGAELELSAQIDDKLAINLNLGYLEGEYDELIGDFGLEVSAERELVNAPQWNGRLDANYQIPLQNSGSVVLTAGVSSQSKTYLTVSSSEVLAQGGFELFDASIMYLSPDRRWSLSLQGQNLTDKEYREHGFDLSASPGIELGYYGAPRTYSMNFRYGI